MSQFRCVARLSAMTLGLLLAGCGDGQQSDLASKQKALMGGQGASPASATEADPQQARQNRLNELLKKAEVGDVLAMVEVGKAYELGQEWGKPKQFDLQTTSNDPLLNLEKAVEWYERAVKYGNAEAQGRLGKLSYEGRGLHKDFHKAFELFQSASSQGDAYAMFGLARMYGSGEGIPKDDKKARLLIQDAASRGLQDAQLIVGLRYSGGSYGFAKDAAEAVKWWRLAAEQGNWFAQLQLARAYRDGEGVPKDTLRAMEWYRKSAAQGDWLPQSLLAHEYADSKSPRADNVLAYAWFNLAASKDTRSGENRDSVARLMSPEEIAEAQRLASGWKVGQILTREGAAGAKHPYAQAGLVKNNTGTAFIVNAAGYAITNHHVVEGCAEVRAEGRNGVVRVVTSDLVNDLAQLQIPGAVSAQAPIASNPAKLRQGEDIVVFGFPLNAVLSSGGNLTPGVVSALTGLGNNTNQIQITAPIQPGSSGSPVINKKGEVVGVVAMKLSDSKMARATGQVGQNVNFAVSGQTLKTFLDTHKVEYGNSGMFSFGSKNTADLAEEARKWTLVVECWK